MPSSRRRLPGSAGVGHRSARRARPEPAQAEVDRGGRALVEVTGEPASALRAAIPAGACIVRRAPVGERVQLELPLGRAPPQGASGRALVVIRAPRGPSRGFDERLWLRRQGVHVVAQGRRAGTSSGTAAASAASPTGSASWLRRARRARSGGGPARGPRRDRPRRRRRAHRRAARRASAGPGSTTCSPSPGRTSCCWRRASRARMAVGLPRWSGMSGRSGRSAPTCWPSARSRR